MLDQRFSAAILLTVMVTAVTAVILASGLLFETKTINNQGNVNSNGVGIYWENTCVNKITTIDWGYLEVGSTQTVTVYIRNEGVDTITLNMSDDNWYPSLADSYLSVDWNSEGSQVEPDSILAAIFTLSVSSNTTTISSFSFDITITGSI